MAGLTVELEGRGEGEDLMLHRRVALRAFDLVLRDVDSVD